MFCSNCGKQVSDLSKFCVNCGVPISAHNVNSKVEVLVPKNETQVKKVGFETTFETAKGSTDNKTDEKKKWWQYKNMGSREIGITALILIFFGFYGFFQNGNGSLIGVGLIFVIAWAYSKRKAGAENKKSLSASEIFKKVFQIIAVVLFIAALSTISSPSSRNIGGWLETIYNYFAIVAVVFLFGMLSLWWKNRKTEKEWFGWRLIIVLILLSVVGLGMTIFSQALTIAREKVAARTDSWPVYNSESPYFSARFPSLPEHKTTSQDISNGQVIVDSYKSADSTASIAYVITVTDFPPTVDLSDSTGTLEKVLNTSASNTKGQIISSNLTTSNGFPAINSVILSSDKTTLKGLTVLVGQRVYQLITAYKSKGESKLEFDKFINSFVVK